MNEFSDADITSGLMTKEVIEVIQRHYPDGNVPVDTLTVVFGLGLASALAGEPFATRKRVGKTVLDMIVNTPDFVKAQKPPTPL